MQKNITEHIGRQIHSRRNELKITQEELAKYVGLSRVQIVNLEKGVNRTTFESLWEICNALSCTVSDLFPPQKKARRKTVTKTVTRMVATKVKVTKTLLTPKPTTINELDKGK